VWEATQRWSVYDTTNRVSIHASRVGGDVAGSYVSALLVVSIHASRVGGDVVFSEIFIVTVVSIHASRVGGDQGSDKG